MHVYTFAKEYCLKHEIVILGKFLLRKLLSKRVTLTNFFPEKVEHPWYRYHNGENYPEESASPARTKSIVELVGEQCKDAAGKAP